MCQTFPKLINYSWTIWQPLTVAVKKPLHPWFFLPFCTLTSLSKEKRNPDAKNQSRMRGLGKFPSRLSPSVLTEFSPLLGWHRPAPIEQWHSRSVHKCAAPEAQDVWFVSREGGRKIERSGQLRAQVLDNQNRHKFNEIPKDFFPLLPSFRRSIRESRLFLEICQMLSGLRSLDWTQFSL